MQKAFFHNGKHNSENNVQKKTIQLPYIDQKRVVDINRLLNRIRIDKKNEYKKNAIFYCSTILGLGFFSVFIMIIKWSY